MHEPRNAKEQIEKAFLDLLEEKSYMDITVTDIVKKADVARVTYYRNFDSISDIIESITDRMADEFVKELAPMLDYGDDRSLREFLFHFFYHLSRNSKTIFIPHSQNKNIIFYRLHDKVRAMEEANDMHSAPEKYNRSAKMAILNDVGQKWVLDGMEETPEEMIDYMMKILRSF